MTRVSAKPYLGGLLYGEGQMRVYCEKGKPSILIKYNEPTLANLLERIAPPPHNSTLLAHLWQIVAEDDPKKMKALIEQLTDALKVANKVRRSRERFRISRRIKKFLRPDDQAESQEMIDKKELTDKATPDEAFIDVVLSLFDELNDQPSIGQIAGRLKRTYSQVSRDAERLEFGWLRPPSTLHTKAR